MSTRPVRRSAPRRPFTTGRAPGPMAVPALIASLLLFSGGSPLHAVPGHDSATARSDLETVIYDVSDLLHRRPDFPAPRLGLGKFDPAPLDHDETETTPWTMETIVDLLERALGEELAAEGRAIRAVRKQLVITAPPTAHAAASTVIDALRVSGGIAYTIDAHWVAWEVEALGDHGFEDLARSRGRAALRLDAERGAALLAAAASDPTAETILAPRLTIFAEQRAHVAILEQDAIVDAVEIGPSGERTERRSEAVTTGITFEVRVSPRRRGGGALLRYDLQIARAIPADPLEVAEARTAGEPELSAPEIEVVRRQGRKGLAEGEWLVLRQLPHPSGEVKEVAGRETLLLVRCLRTDAILGGGERGTGR